MQSSKTHSNQREWIAAGLLILVLAAAAYLLLSGRMGFTSDDWYLVYAGLTGGMEKFIDVFAGDRPFRAYLVGPVFQLFGLRPQFYFYLSYALRVGGALAFFWLIKQIWPRQKWLNAALAALFVVYPGWSDQVIPFDIQSHLLGVAAMLLSFALSVRALYASAVWQKGLLIAAAVLCQMLSLAMMEYYIGMEGLRFALLALIVLDRRPLDAFKHGWLPRWKRLLAAWLPYLVGAGLFLIWRLFIFDNTRGATDISAMLSSVTGSPVMRGLWAAVYLIQDFLNVTILAWGVPLYQQALNLRLRDSLIALGLGALMGLLTWLVLGWLAFDQSVKPASSPRPPVKDSEDESSSGIEMLWIGSLGVLTALAPVVLGMRHVVFPAFSRFTLPASAGGILVLGGLLWIIGRSSPGRLLSRSGIALLIALAITAHYGNAIQFSNTWDTIRNFWWQVSWRAPQIEPETVLAADYSDAGIIEDYYVWGPANLIYYPQRYTVDGVDRTPLAAVLLNTETVQSIQMGLTLNERERRGLTSTQDLTRLLLLSMPTPGSCVHLIDGRAPELSSHESYAITLAAPASRAELVLVNQPAPTPPAELFGTEPAHHWCFYYQKASLARQQGDWAEVARLGDEAISKNERPSDWVEWMPFVQAYAYLGRYEEANQIAVILKDLPFLKYQACDVFTRDHAGYGANYAAGQQYLKETFCH